MRITKEFKPHINHKKINLLNSNELQFLFMDFNFSNINLINIKKIIHLSIINMFMISFSFLNEKDIPIAIVTGASRDRIKEHLDEKISVCLKALVTADDVIHTKPHPEPYLSAATILGINAIECLVIENAILGIHSAKSAGCHCFAL